MKTNLDELIPTHSIYCTAKVHDDAKRKRKLGDDADRLRQDKPNRSPQRDLVSESDIDALLSENERAANSAAHDDRGVSVGLVEGEGEREGGDKGGERVVDPWSNVEAWSYATGEVRGLGVMVLWPSILLQCVDGPPPVML